MSSIHLSPHSCIGLPQATFDFHRSLPKTRHLLFLGGRAPSLSWARSLCQQKVRSTIYAIDRGVGVCRSLNLFPDVLLGDADSPSREDWAWGETHAKTIERHPVEKDFTDTQLALERLKDSEAMLILTGAFGGRFDHAYSTIFSAAQAKNTCVLADERETITYLHAGDTLTIACQDTPKALSLLPMTEAVTGVTTNGLHWELDDATLTQAHPYAVSNVLSSNTTSCSISIGQGCLAVYLCWVNR